MIREYGSGYWALARDARLRWLGDRHTWAFERLDAFRRRTIQRAGRLIRPQGQLALSMSANPAVQEELLHYLEALQTA